VRAKKSTAAHRRPPKSRRLLALVAVAGVAVAGSAATGSHTVSSGQTLSQIAARYGVSVTALAQANGIADVHRILAGQTLTMPDAAASPAAPPTHDVAPGETLSQIAARYGVGVAALAQANGISDVHRIRAGEALAIPSGGGTAAAPARGGGTETSRFPARLQASPERLALVPRFEHWAATSGVPVDLLMAMTWLESGWQNDVVSSAGAIGIGQLMPDTVTWLEDIVIREPLDPHDPDDNIRMSARYLRWLLDRTGGDAATALAGYYQGLGAVRSSGVFPSTRVYVADVLFFRDRHF
jgi:LysM repeat protein